MTKPIFFIIPSKKYKKCINIYLEWLLLGWLLLSIFADFEHVKKLSSYFPDFEQVKKTDDKTPAGETRCLCIYHPFYTFSLAQCRVIRDFPTQPFF